MPVLQRAAARLTDLPHLRRRPERPDRPRGVAGVGADGRAAGRARPVDRGAARAGIAPGPVDSAAPDTPYCRCVGATNPGGRRRCGPGGRPARRAAGPPPATATTTPVRPAPEWTRRKVQNLLLSLGVGLLAVAAVIFLVVSWSVLGIGGRAAVMAGCTVLAGGGAALASRRGLGSTAEAVSLLTVGLGLLDGVGARQRGWPASTTSSGSSTGRGRWRSSPPSARPPPSSYPHVRCGSLPQCWASCRCRCSPRICLTPPASRPARHRGRAHPLAAVPALGLAAGWPGRPRLATSGSCSPPAPGSRGSWRAARLCRRPTTRRVPSCRARPCSSSLRWWPPAQWRQAPGCPCWPPPAGPHQLAWWWPRPGRCRRTGWTPGGCRSRSRRWPLRCSPGRSLSPRLHRRAPALVALAASVAPGLAAVLPLGRPLAATSAGSDRPWQGVAHGSARQMLDLVGYSDGVELGHGDPAAAGLRRHCAGRRRPRPRVPARRPGRCAASGARRNDAARRDGPDLRARGRDSTWWLPGHWCLLVPGCCAVDSWRGAAPAPRPGWSCSGWPSRGHWRSKPPRWPRWPPPPCCSPAPPCWSATDLPWHRHA